MGYPTVPTPGQIPQSAIPEAPYNTRTLTDANYVTSIALAAASSTKSNSAALDLIQATPYPVTEKIIVQVAVAATASTNNTATGAVTAVLQHTGALATGLVDTANFANIPELAAPLSSTASVNGVAAASTKQVLLPPGCKRFIRVQTATGSDVGDLSATKATLSVLF